MPRLPPDLIVLGEDGIIGLVLMQSYKTVGDTPYIDQTTGQTKTTKRVA